MKSELETLLDQIKEKFKSAGDLHFSWAHSSVSLDYELIVSNADKAVIQHITELELEAAENLELLVSLKVQGMVHALQSQVKIPQTKVLKAPKELKVEPPQVESLDELYAGADWEGIISQDVKAKSKSKKPTAAQLEFKYKHQLTEGAYLSAWEAGTEKYLKEMSKLMFAENPLLKHLKSK